MITRTREAIESPQSQGSNEEVIYTLSTTNYGGTRTSITVRAILESTDEVVTTTVFPTNTTSVADDDITLSALKELTAGETYRVYVLFTADATSIFEPYFRIVCRDD